MTDTSSTGLNYGHFGLPVYDLYTKKWHFCRKPANARKFHWLEPLTPIIPPFVKALPCSDAHESPHSRDVRISDLIERFPEIYAAQKFLAPLEQVSEAVVSAERHDAVEGDVLAFGRASDFDGDSRKGNIRIVAVPSGDSGSDLRLIRIFEERQGWGKHRGIGLQVPSISGESGFWQGDGASIRQICSSTSENQGTFFAVRLANRTHVFRPLYHRLHPQSLDASKYPVSRLSANPILSISTGLTGNMPHADVAFNPWYPRQLAIIDQNSNWSIFNIGGQQAKRRLTYSATKVKAGHISGVFERPEAPVYVEQPAPGEDGWARLTWLHDVHTIVVCNRRRISLFDMSQESPRMVSPTLNMDRTSDWILDVKTNQAQKEQLLVLTTTRLFVLHYSRSEGLEANPSCELSLNVAFSWRHFRDMEDWTLRISTSFIGEEMLAVIHSRMNDLVTIFRSAFSTELSSLVTSPSDPVELTLGLHREDSSEMNSTLPISLKLTPLEYYENSYSTDISIGAEYRDRGVCFLTMVSLHKDFGLSQAMLYTYNTGDGHLGSPVVLPQWNRKTSRSTVSTVIDDFVIPDGPLDDELTSASRIQLLTSPPNPDSARSSALLKWRSLETVTNERLYRSIQRSDRESPVELKAICQAIREYMDSLAIRAEQPFGILSDYALRTFMVHDLDEDSEALQQLLQYVSSPPEADEAPIEIQWIAALDSLNVALPGRVTSLLGIYEDIVGTWISSLTETIPSSVSFSKERLARKVAAEVLLSSTRIRFQISPVDEQAEETAQVASKEQPLDSMFALPVRPSRGMRDFEPLSSQSQTALPLDDQPLPTPSATPSVVSRSSFSSTLSSLGGISNQLKQHLEMTKPAPHLSQPLTYLLAHWSLGEDPDSYDWEAATATIANEGAAEGMTERERNRLRRKSKKLLEKQRREAVRMSAAALSSSQPVLQQSLRADAHPRTSPGPAIGIPSSEVPWGMSSQAMPASQNERGPHGGRPVKRKKIRQKGF